MVLAVNIDLAKYNNNIIMMYKNSTYQAMPQSYLPCMVCDHLTHVHVCMYSYKYLLDVYATASFMSQLCSSEELNLIILFNVSTHYFEMLLCIYLGLLRCQLHIYITVNFLIRGHTACGSMHHCITMLTVYCTVNLITCLHYVACP